MIIHFDGDLLVYRAGFAAEKMHYYVHHGDKVVHCQYKADVASYVEEHGLEQGEFEVESRRIAEPVANALYNVRMLVETTLKNLKESRKNLRVYLSGSTNFREGIATIKPYKGNRDPEHKPLHGPAIKEYMIKKYKANVSDGEEADDVVAYSHYAMWEEDEYSSVICSVDKDLDMVPGLHYNFVKEQSYYVTPEKGMWYFYRQLLTGDSTDNIPGVAGIGPKKAEAALADCDDPWAAIVPLYVQGYGEDWYDALVENGRLLWMRRKPDEWWSPPEGVTSYAAGKDEDE